MPDAGGNIKGISLSGKAGETLDRIFRDLPTAHCEECGSTNLELDGWDIDKCRDCGHWRYR